MTAEQQAFLALLRDHYNQTRTAEIPPETDCEELARLAREQSLSGVIYVQLKALGDAVPAEWLEKLRPGFFNDVFHAVNYGVDLADMESWYEEEIRVTRDERGSHARQELS